MTDKSKRSRLALLITNVDFDDVALKRNGAEKDENMEKLLTALGYEVVKHRNLSGKVVSQRQEKELILQLKD